MGKGGYHGGSTVVGFSGSGWIGRGSVTMQPASKKSGTPSSSKAKKKSGKPGAPALPSRKGNGLTIPDQIAKARNRIETVEAEIAKTRKRLIDLDRQLAEAKRQLEGAEKLPRRSALGRALAKATEPQA